MLILSRYRDLFNEFGAYVCFVKSFQTLVKNIPWIKNLAGICKYNVITQYLYNDFIDIIEQFNFNSQKNLAKIGKDFSIWVMWWQGIDNAPDIVKTCVKSIFKHRGNHEVIIIDQYNYSKYVFIDDKYISMLNEGFITKTQFSDILRLNLLYQNGGVWLDATYLLTEDISNTIADYEFYTIRHGKNRTFPMSKGLWTGSAIGFSKHNECLELIIKLYETYFDKHKVLVDYFLIDYIFAVCCDNSNRARKMFLSVPKNNINVNGMLPLLNKLYNENELSDTLKNTYMNKLSWKIRLNNSKANEITVYQHFKKEFANIKL
jgi:hypothetical protein